VQQKKGVTDECKKNRNKTGLRGNLFKTQNEREDDGKEKITELPLSELNPFKDHPFRVNDDTELNELAKSIKENGIVTPAIARLCPKGVYELIAGHRRKAACEIAGLATMPVIIRELDDDAATIIMVDSNRQRENLLREDMRKMDEYSVQAKLLCKYRVETKPQPVVVISVLAKEKDNLIAESKNFEYRKRRTKDVEKIESM